MVGLEVSTRRWPTFCREAGCGVDFLFRVYACRPTPSLSNQPFGLNHHQTAKSSPVGLHVPNYFIIMSGRQQRVMVQPIVSFISPITH